MAIAWAVETGIWARAKRCVLTGVAIVALILGGLPILATEFTPSLALAAQNLSTPSGCAAVGGIYDPGTPQVPVPGCIMPAGPQPSTPKITATTYCGQMAQGYQLELSAAAQDAGDQYNVNLDNQEAAAIKQTSERLGCASLNGVGGTVAGAPASGANGPGANGPSPGKALSDALADATNQAQQNADQRTAKLANDVNASPGIGAAIGQYQDANDSAPSAIAQETGNATKAAEQILGDLDKQLGSSNGIGAQTPPDVVASQTPAGGSAAQTSPGGATDQTSPGGAAQTSPGQVATQTPPGATATQTPPGGETNPAIGPSTGQDLANVDRGASSSSLLAGYAGSGPQPGQPTLAIPVIDPNQPAAVNAALLADAAKTPSLGAYGGGASPDGDADGAARPNRKLGEPSQAEHTTQLSRDSCAQAHGDVIQLPESRGYCVLDVDQGGPTSEWHYLDKDPPPPGSGEPEPISAPSSADSSAR